MMRSPFAFPLSSSAPKRAFRPPAFAGLPALTAFDRKLEALRAVILEIARNGFFMDTCCHAYEELERWHLAGNCGLYSRKLQDVLEGRGIQTRLFSSEDPIAFLPDDRGSYHLYLSLVLEGREVVLDPTAGQFIKGYHAIFVGTRQDLKALVLDPATELLSTSPRLNREEAFRSHWGALGRAL